MLQRGPMKQIIIGTHHKVGSVLMGGIFQKIALKSGLRFIDCSEKDVSESHADFDILYDYNSQFQGLDLQKITRIRGVHVIRDPRMIVVSATFYHLTSKEDWLHQPQVRFNGLSYQEKLKSLETNEKRFEFEMLNKSYSTINNLIAWCRQKYEWCMDVTLENLMTDQDLHHYQDLFTFLGLEGSALLSAMMIAYENSVFNENYNNSHIRSRTVENWQHYFSSDLEIQFKELFGSAVEDLGYSWQ